MVLSPSSTSKIYELGIESIPSESECYPAKLAHGHVTVAASNRASSSSSTPAFPTSGMSSPDANNHYNCPIVTSYAENIKNNMEETVRERQSILSIRSWPLTNEEISRNGWSQEFGRQFHISGQRDHARLSTQAGRNWPHAREDMQHKGRRDVLAYMEKTGSRGIVLAGRPYHVDPEINHGIPELITSYGIAVLTEDSVSHLGTRWSAR